MNLVQSYVFRKLLGAFLIAFPGLAITIWATQALGRLSLVTDRGQGLGVFLQATVLLLPGLVMIVGPATMLIVVVYVINSLSSDSELVSIGSSGRSQGVLLRPLFALAAPILLLSIASSLYFRPIAAQGSQQLVAEVNANAIGNLIRPGQFLTLGDDVVIQVRDVGPGGTLSGIFVFDQRDPAQSVAYIAGAGAIVNRDEGIFLVMQDGVVQRRSTGTDAVSTIEFQSYAFDLSSLGNRADVAIGPGERSTLYLLQPDPNDPIQRADPFRYRAEFHNRITVPLYVLVLTLVPAAFLSSARSPRQGRGLLTTGTVLLSGLLLGCNLYFGGALESGPWLLGLVYAVPVGGIVLPIVFLATGRRIRLPRWRLFRPRPDRAPAMSPVR
jgi:lipopolysaccharide export system permease protein